MRSKTSFFNLTLFKKNLARFWPLWGLTSFVGALVPLNFLLQLLRYGGVGEMTALDLTGGYYAVLAYAVPIISLLYAIACAMTVWSYLCNPRSTGMVHRLPIRREGLFVTNFLSGLAMMAIPYAVVGVLSVILGLAAGAFAPKALLVTILGVMGESFFYFSTATLAAFLTGHISALPVLYFLLHFMQPLVMFLSGLLQDSFYFGVTGSNLRLGRWLCPTVELIDKVSVRPIYAEPDPTADRYAIQQMVDVQLENGWLIAVYALAGLVILALAYGLYRKRSSENAGEVAAFRWLRPVYRYLVALLGGIIGGLILYSLLWQPFQRHSDMEILPLLVCMAIAGLIGYYAISMVLAKSLKVFRGSAKGAAVAVGLLALICAVLHFDLLGVEHYVPDPEDVEQAEVWMNAGYTMVAGQDDELLAQFLAVHQAIVDDLDLVEQKERDGGYTDLGGDEGFLPRETYLHVSVDYRLRSGETVRRSYPLYLSRERLAQEGTYDQLIDRFVNSTDALRLRLNADRGLRCTGGSLEDADYNVGFEITPDQGKALWAAVIRDAENGDWGRMEWFYDTIGPEFAHLELWLVDPTDPNDYGSHNLYIDLRPEMAETIALLRQLGLMRTDRLHLTNPNEESVEFWDGEQYVSPDSVDEITVSDISSALAEDGSLGIIGGADGPTEVFVTGG